MDDDPACEMCREGVVVALVDGEIAAERVAERLPTRSCLGLGGEAGHHRSDDGQDQRQPQREDEADVNPSDRHHRSRRRRPQQPDHERQGSLRHVLVGASPQDPEVATQPGRHGASEPARGERSSDHALQERCRLGLSARDGSRRVETSERIRERQGCRRNTRSERQNAGSEGEAPKDGGAHDEASPVAAPMRNRSGAWNLAMV